MQPSARLPGDLSLGAVRLRTADVTRAGAWLERVLGLRPLAEGTWGASPATPLVALRAVPGARRVPRRGLLGLYHYALLLPSRGDLGRFLLHLEDLAEPFGASDHLVSEALYLTDPDGLTVEVYADRPRERWTRTGDALDMALDPLDRPGLEEAANGRRWSGVPEDTRMGHLHFYVGDLAAAERHYVRGLGFDVMTRRLPGALFVAAGGYHHHVGLNTWAAGSPVAGPGDAGLDEWTM
ncbi:MAG TPA: VOC family protein, partial [Methylomirabilota bacterium]|nr:VOC family protein [Methylomirabilota bacterium]